MAYLNKTLPCSIDAEESLLAHMIQYPDECLDDILSKLPEEAFHKPSHRTIYRLLEEMYSQKKPIDLLLITQELTDKSLLKEIGGPSEITRIATLNAWRDHQGDYIKVVRDKWNLRAALQVFDNGKKLIYEEGEQASDVLDQIEAQILSIRDRTQIKEDYKSLSQAVDETLHDIEECILRQSGNGIKTGFPRLDFKLNGMKGGDMIVLAARPSIGKTALGMNIITHVCIHQNIPSLVFSLEMSTQLLVKRLIASYSGTDLSKIFSGLIPSRDQQRLMNSTTELKKANLFINDKSALSIHELRAVARRLYKRKSIRFIMIDYLQLMRSKSKRAQDNRQIEVSEISASIKSLAKELDIPILVLAQLNREIENRADRKPRLSDLRESGSIEADADTVMLLSRPDKDENDNEELDKAILNIAKQRNGPTGEIEFELNKRLTKFEEKTHHTYYD